MAYFALYTAWRNIHCIPFKYTLFNLYILFLTEEMYFVVIILMGMYMQSGHIRTYTDEKSENYNLRYTKYKPSIEEPST